MNKEFPFIMRKGFDQNQGILRRCKIRQIHVPPELDAEVSYLTNDGQEKIHVVTWFRKNDEIIYKDTHGETQRTSEANVEFLGIEPAEGYGSNNGQVKLPKNPQGMELKAVRQDKTIIVKWR
tara:strand:- start:15872 stop:16237 length:366 start_codon:yes stop_codon:yes gene_type:complete